MSINSVEGNFVQQGEELIFSHYEDSGPMWSGDGQRQVSYHIEFDRPFIGNPIVQLSITLMDVQTDPLIRYDISATEITSDGFSILFQTWADSRFARVRVGWIAIGQSIRDEYWVDF